MNRPLKMAARISSVLVGLVLLAYCGCAVAASATAQAISGADTADASLQLELTVQDGAVTGMTVYDATGNLLPYKADLTAATPQQALSALLSELEAAGALSQADGEAYLLIGTAGDILDADLAAELRAIARDFLHNLDSDATVDWTALGADVSAKAATLGLPGGRYLMMEYIARQQGIPVEEAIALYAGEKVRDLMRQFEGLREAMGEGVNGEGEQGGEGEQVREQEETQEQLQQEAEEGEHREKQEEQQLRHEDEQTEETSSDTDNGNGNGSGGGGGSSNGNSNGKGGGKK
ncbi:MAG: hypothetical protein GX418_08740 [Clostridiales bacterium]|nr:hypothetical protein [Clostridiales bacterium]